MKVNTTRFGRIDIDKEMIIHFPSGIAGHERLKRFFLIDHKNTLKWLHAVDDPAVAFIAVEPFGYFPSYSFMIDDDVEGALEIRDPSDIAVLVFLSAYNNRVTANLKAPVIINSSNKKAAQITVGDRIYSVRAPLPGIL